MGLGLGGDKQQNSPPPPVKWAASPSPLMSPFPAQGFRGLEPASEAHQTGFGSTCDQLCCLRLHLHQAISRELDWKKNSQGVNQRPLGMPAFQAAALPTKPPG